jgi:hypothetical protein
MISPISATIIIVTFIILFGVGVPILDRKAPKYISYRWCVVVVILALLIGVIVDFDALSDESRQVVLIGGLVISGGYVALRTIEKTLANGWLRGAQIEAKKGDISVKVSSAQSLETSLDTLKKGGLDISSNSSKDDVGDE